MDNKRIRVLLVEDDDDYVELMRLCLAEREPMGAVFELDRASTLDQGLRNIAAARYDAALVDLGLPDARELESVKAVRAADPDLPLLVFTNLGMESIALDAIKLGAQDFILKGSSDARGLKRSILYAIERKAAESQREWIGTLSHDLRTPLTIIKGALTDLHSGTAGALSDSQKLLVGLAHRQSERLVSMVLHLLDLARLDSGRVVAACVPFDAAAVVRRAAGDFARAAADRALSVETELAEGGVAWSGDPDLFEQLVVNLTDNALRFARKRIVVRLLNGPAGLELQVQDDGIGIPPEKRAALFTRFSQLERPKQSGYKGTGLGLAICKEIAALHGGTIGLGEAAEGTVFVVRLPLRVSSPRTPPPVAASALRT